MVARIAEKLMTLSDWYADKNDKESREVVQKCLSIVNNVWYTSDTGKRQVFNKEPESEIERFVLTIPDLEIHHDPYDDQYIYELDEAHFDSPEEVMQYLVDFRTKQRIRAMSEAKKEMLKAMADMIQNMNSVIKKSEKPRNAVKAKIKVVGKDVE